MGIDSFVTLDNGTKFHHPRPYKTTKEKLAYLNRKLTLKQRNSNNRRKVRGNISKTYEKIANIREDFQHKLSKKLITDNNIMAYFRMLRNSLRKDSPFFLESGVSFVDRLLLIKFITF